MIQNRDELPLYESQWLAQYGPEWSRRRLKWTLCSVTAGTWGSDPETADEGTTCVRVADFDREKHRIVQEPPTRRVVSESEFETRQLSRGDLLIEKSGGGTLQPVGFVALFDGTYDAVCSNFIARLALHEQQCPRYWNYVHAALYDSGLNIPSIKQTTGIQNLDLGAYLSLHVLVPPLPSQRAIATYLDRETAKIDAMVAAKELLLVQLAEKRRALITHVVTRGLNPDAPTKDSGVEWLGEIPEHWSADRLKFHMTGIEQGWSPQCLNIPAGPDEWGVLKAGCVNGMEFDPDQNKTLPPDLDPKPELEIKDGDVLMSRSNTVQLLGSTALVDTARPKLILCDKLYRLHLNPETIHKPYLVYLLRSPMGRFEFERDATGASNSMQNIGQDSVKNVWLPIPPLDEQIQIAEFVRNQAARFDSISMSAHGTVHLLKERRSALIAAAVTGKVDVEDAA